jgi:hypothetical protein
MAFTELFDVSSLLSSFFLRPQMPALSFDMKQPTAHSSHLTPFLSLCHSCASSQFPCSLPAFAIDFQPENFNILNWFLSLL